MTFMIKELFFDYQKKSSKYEQEFRKILTELVTFPTVADRETKAINDCADSLEGFLKQYGYSVTQYPTREDGYPVVFAEKNVGAPKTMLFYHHYDVQPEDPLDKWVSSPWKLTERDGRIYGRGVADDKGEFVISMLAMDLLEKELGTLPVNIKFVLEGEEEAGSEHLPVFAKKHSELLKADGSVWEGNLLFPSKDNPTTYDTPVGLICGLKGTIYYEVTTKGPPYFPRTDVHSGEAAATPNAAWSLIWGLSTLKDENENILIDGFNELVQDPLEEDLAELKKANDSFERRIVDDYQLGHALLNRTGTDLLIETLLKPSLSICGLDSGYQGPGSKTIVPAKAMAKVDFRLVPNLTMEKVDELVQQHLKKHNIDYLDFKSLGGYDPAKTPVNHPYVQMVKAVSAEITGKPVEIIPIAAGSGPAYLFTPYVPICMAGNDAVGLNGHAPNENMPADCISPSIAYNAVIAYALGKTAETK